MRLDWSALRNSLPTMLLAGSLYIVDFWLVTSLINMFVGYYLVVSSFNIPSIDFLLIFSVFLFIIGMISILPATIRDEEGQSYRYNQLTSLVLSTGLAILLIFVIQVIAIMFGYLIIFY